MSLARCYLTKKMVLIPTVSKADAGFYLDTDPVYVVDLSNTKLLKQHLIDQLNEGNKEIPTPAVTKPGSVILEKLDMTNWQAFEREAVMYTLHTNDDGASLYVTGRASNGLWSHNKDYEHKFPASATAEEIAEALAERLTWQSQTEWPEKPAAMLAPPKQEK